MDAPSTVCLLNPESAVQLVASDTQTCRVSLRGSCLSDVYVINSSRYVVKRAKSQSSNALFFALLAEHLQRQKVNILICLKMTTL